MRAAASRGSVLPNSLRAESMSQRINSAPESVEHSTSRPILATSLAKRVVLGQLLTSSTRTDFFAGCPRYFSESVAVLRNELFGPVDHHEAAVAPHGNGQQLVAHRFEFGLVAWKAGQTERFFVTPQNVLREPLEGGPLQVPFVAGQNGDRADVGQGFGFQKGDGVHDPSPPAPLPQGARGE